MHSRTRLAAAAIAVVAALALGGCSSTTPAPVSTEFTGEKATIEMWGSNAALKKLADRFNEDQDNITVKFVEQAGLAEMGTNLRNAFAAGGGPDIFDNTTESLTSLASDGIAADLTDLAEAYASDYTPAAWDAVHAGDAIYGLPASSIPQFMLYNADVFKTAGLEYPTTWDEFVEDGKVLSQQGVSIMNLAGEDYTNYVYMAWQAGARWWKLDGDTWTVNVDSKETAAGVDILQRLIDDGSVSKISYAEYAALMQQFNDGKIASRQLSTWQTRGMQSNLTTGLGQWEPAHNLALGDGDSENVSFTRVYAVNSKSKHQDAAAFFAHWISTNEDVLASNASPTDGAAWFPAVADASKYVSISEPTELLGDQGAAWEPVVTNAIDTQRADWTYGPNAPAAFSELANQWGKALAGQIRVADIAPHMQDWIVKDLERAGISVKEG